MCIQQYLQMRLDNICRFTEDGRNLKETNLNRQALNLKKQKLY